MKAMTPRKLAIAAGERRYHDGKPCRRGHIGLRLTSNAGCVECARLYQLQPHIAERNRLHAKRSIARDPDRAKHRVLAWRAANPDKAKATVKRYNLKYPQRSIHQVNMRRARKQNATPSWMDKAAIRRVYELCPPGYHVDHIVPLGGRDVCGLHVPWNLQYLTVSDNCRKSNKFDARMAS